MLISVDLSAATVTLSATSLSPFNTFSKVALSIAIAKSLVNSTLSFVFTFVSVPLYVSITSVLYFVYSLLFAFSK